MPKDSDPFLAVYCWTGEIPGKFWFCDHEGDISRKYSKNINDPMEDIERYYNSMASDYEHVVRSWGYNMPEAVLEALITYGNLEQDRSFSILDLGCGDGLCGLLLKVNKHKCTMIGFGYQCRRNLFHFRNEDFLLIT